MINVLKFLCKNVVFFNFFLVVSLTKKSIEFKIARLEHQPSSEKINQKVNMNFELQKYPRNRTMFLLKIIIETMIFTLYFLLNLLFFVFYGVFFLYKIRIRYNNNFFFQNLFQTMLSFL